MNLKWNSIGDSGTTALSYVSTVNTMVHVGDLVLVDDEVKEKEYEKEGDKDKEKYINR